MFWYWSILNGSFPLQGAEGRLLLEMLSTECYRTCQFMMSARGHAYLLQPVEGEDDEDVTTEMTHRQGLRGAIVGAFQQVCLQTMTRGRYCRRLSSGCFTEKDLGAPA